jgi:hypothetical protein
LPAFVKLSKSATPLLQVWRPSYCHEPRSRKPPDRPIRPARTGIGAHLPPLAWCTPAGSARSIPKSLHRSPPGLRPCHAAFCRRTAGRRARPRIVPTCRSRARLRSRSLWGAESSCRGTVPGRRATSAAGNSAAGGRPRIVPTCRSRAPEQAVPVVRGIELSGNCSTPANHLRRRKQRCRPRAPARTPAPANRPI